MAALDFPDNPAIGDMYGSESTVWRWDGTAWNSTAGTSGPRGVVATATLKGTTLAVPANPALTAIPGLTATFIADPSRIYRTTVTGVIVGPLATGFELQVADAVGTKLQGASTNYLHPTYGSNLIASLVETGLSGSITRQAIGSGLGGACTFYGQPSFPAQIVVEDVTYEAGSSGTPQAFSSGGGSGFTFVQDTVPVAAKQGDTWFNTATDAGSGRSCVAIDEGSGELVWVQFSPGSGVPAVQVPWLPLAFAAGWTDYAAGYQPGQYRKIGDIVYLRGLVTQVAGSTTSIATLPVGYRPLGVELCVVMSAYGTLAARVDINPSGTINMTPAPTVGYWVALTSLQFSVT